MTPTWGKGISKMTRGQPQPVAETPKTDATPRPFGLMPLPDACIVPARCGACGGRRHYGLPAGQSWAEARGGLRCLDCGAAGTLRMEATP